jgi:hypothetical protein
MPKNSNSCFFPFFSSFVKVRLIHLPHKSPLIIVLFDDSPFIVMCDSIVEDPIEQNPKKRKIYKGIKN